MVASAGDETEGPHVRPILKYVSLIVNVDWLLLWIWYYIIILEAINIIDEWHNIVVL